MNKNFYEILHASPNATLDELKSNYKHLILQCHPDKLIQQQQQHQHPADGNDLGNADKLENDLNNKEFVAISEAWNCLKDPSRRKQYDAELLLNKFHTHNNIYAHIRLSEMKKCLQTMMSSDYGVGDEVFNNGIIKGLDENGEAMKSDNNKESYFYTYDCRCGGQYIVDESAEQYCRKVNSSDNATADVIHDKGSGGGVSRDFAEADDAAYTEKNNSPNKTAAFKNRGRGGTIHDDGLGSVDVDTSGGTQNSGINVFDEDINRECDSDKDDDGELIVECSECSLVIILNG